MPKSVIYCRVSSDRQVKEGHGLDGQELRCRKYSDEHGYEVAAVFRDEKLRHARIILLHGAYPFYEEGAYLANVFPNVYLDLSEFNPLVVRSVRRVYATILEMAPFTKVAYSSDAFGSPELQWVAGRKGREALSSVLTEAVDADKLSREAARTAARLIFADNARAIYGL